MILVAVVAAYITIAYKREVVVPVEADLAKYPELSPFQVGRSGFRGIKFDMDTNDYSFAFPVSFGDAKSFFGAVDAAAAFAGWNLTEAGSAQRVYLRRKERPIGPLVGDQVTLRYDPQEREVTLLRQDVAEAPKNLNERFLETNKTIPGAFAIPGMGILSAGAAANAVGAQTLMQATINQFANGLANFAHVATGTSPPPVNWPGAIRGAALNFVAVSAAFEAGLYAGSAISVGLDDAVYGAPDTGKCDCAGGGGR